MAFTMKINREIIKILDEIERMESILKLKAPDLYNKHIHKLRELYLESFGLEGVNEFKIWGMEVEDLFALITLEINEMMYQYELDKGDSEGYKYGLND